MGQHHRRILHLELSKRAKGSTARRWPCTISSEAPVERRDRSGVYLEVLSHEPGAVDLSRAPLPVLEGHDSADINIGLVERVRLDGRRLRGELVLGASARAAELATDIDSGIVRGLSVG